MSQPSGQDNSSAPYGSAGGTSQIQTPEQANPDLDRILAELAGYKPTAHSAVVAPAPFSTHHVPQQLPARDSSTAAPSTLQNAAKAPVLSTSRHIATPPAQAHSPQIDPSTIFEWPQALRCVNKISVSNPRFGPKIREMMADQDRNVKQWWDDRNNLINSQKTKNEGRRNLNEVLKGIGGKLEAESTHEQDQAELDRFDKKVYQASQQMTRAHGVELKRLGVPFFGVNPKHIIANELQQTTAARDALSQATITELELQELQRKMIQYLEDLYKD